MTDTSQDTPLYMYCREPRELGVIRLKKRKLGEFFQYVADWCVGLQQVQAETPSTSCTISALGLEM